MSGPIRAYKRGQIYHIYNRGNRREAIFRDNLDRIYFLSKVDEYTQRERITLLAYCLMDNHLHLLLRQDTHRPISRVMHSLATSYVKAFNHKYGLVGRLFQERYRTTLITDEGHLAWVSRYIHLNPAKIADYRTYRWSSYRQYMSKTDAGLCDVGPVLDCFRGSKDSYAIYVRKGLKPGLAERYAKIDAAAAAKAAIKSAQRASPEFIKNPY